MICQLFVFAKLGFVEYNFKHLAKLGKYY
jgi:hypothetical protein